MNRRKLLVLMMGGGGPVRNKILTTRQPSLLLYYPMDEASGTTAINAAPGRSGINFCPNPGFESVGAGGPDIWASWSEDPATGTLTDEVVITHSLGHACKITAGANATVIWATASIVPGASYTFSFWARGDGVSAGRYAVYDSTNGAYIRAATSTGVTGLAYALVSYTFVAPVGCTTIQFILRGSATVGAESYYDDVSITGPANATLFNSTYTGGVTLGQSGYSGVSALFDGVNDHIPLHANWSFVNTFPSLAAAGTMICYGKTTAAALVDAQSHWLFKFKSNPTSHYIDIFKNNSNPGLLGFQYEDDASGALGNVAAQLATINWFSVGASWSVANGLRMYINGLLVDTDAGVTGTWDTSYWYSGNLAIGVGLDSGTGWWPGWLQHFAIWDAELTPAEVRQIAQI